MAGQQRKSGGAQQRQPAVQQQQQRAPTENEQISAQERMAALLTQIRQRKAEIVAVLPSDVPFEKFEACFNMAVRREPKLLDCYGPTLIRAAIQSAYDGLMPDGREAVILYSRNKIPGTDRYRLEARYQSMVYGVRKKIVEAGAATHIDGVIVHKNDHFRFEEGERTIVEHTPAGLDQDPGERIGAYARATLPDGTVVFDVMRKHEVMAAREVAMTKNVWDGPFGGEMWKKTAIRRLAKALPTSKPIRDAEAADLYPQFAPADTPPALLGRPDRPQRSQFDRLEHQPEESFGFEGFMSGADHQEEVVHAEATQTESTPAKTVEKSDRPAETLSQDEGKGEGNGSGDPAPDGAAEQRLGGSNEPAAADVPVPVTSAEWERWSRETLVAIGQCRDVVTLDDLNRRHAKALAAAPKQHKNPVANSFADKRVDLQENADGQD